MPDEDKNINNARANMYDAQAQAAAQAGSAVMQAGLGMVQNDLTYSAMENMFLDDWKRMMGIKNHNN